MLPILVLIPPIGAFSYPQRFSASLYFSGSILLLRSKNLEIVSLYPRRTPSIFFSIKSGYFLPIVSSVIFIAASKGTKFDALHIAPSITIFILVLLSIAIFCASIQNISPPQRFKAFCISSGEREVFITTFDFSVNPAVTGTLPVIAS